MKKENENTGVQKILEIKSLEERIKDLIEIGKKKKYITFEQLADALKGLEIDNDSLDEIYNTLMENEIQVVADEDEATDEDGVPKVIEEEPIILINPEIKKQKGEQIVEEGCLSFPNKFAKVVRPKEIVVEGLNKEGITIIMVSHDIHAAVQYANYILHINQKQFFFGEKEAYLKSEEWKLFQ